MRDDRDKGTGLIRPSGQTLMEKVESNRGTHIRHKQRKSVDRKDADEQLATIGVRTASVTGAAFVVGLAQGHFGTSRVGKVPLEAAAGLALHAVSFMKMPPGARRVVRGLADGSLAAAAVTLGYQVGLPTHAKPAAPTQNLPAGPTAPPPPPPPAKGPGVHGDPPRGQGGLSDEELAHFAQRG